jgi:delta1-piperideine-2-carboxylate reductase
MAEVMTLSLEEIGSLAQRVLLASGANDETAQVLTDLIRLVERDGPRSHGLAMLPSYATSIRDGWANGQAEPRVDVRGGAALHVDGANGYAQVALRRSRDHAVEMARHSGCAVLAFRNVHHIGPLGPDVEPFAEQGLCALAFVNSAALLVPWQGETAAFGTNPMAFACPRPSGPPIVWDQASSIFSIASIGQARAQGSELEEAAGLDANGVPSRDPSIIYETKKLLPFAKHKGSAIALMVEVLAAALTGGSLAVRDRPANEPRSASKDCGQLVILIDPDLVGGHDFALRLAPLLEALADNGTARIPGDGRLTRRAQSLTSGVEVNASLLVEIEGLTPPA